MRIGIDASILAPATRYSGIGRYVATLAEHTPAAAPEHEFVLYAPTSAGVPARLAPNCRWHSLPLPRLGKLSMLYACQRTLPRLAREHGLDVFHAPTVHPRPAWPSVPRGMPCPLVVTLHDVIPLTEYARGPHRLPTRQRLFYRWNLRAAMHAARVIAVSDAARDEIVGEAGIDAARITVVHNGVAPGGTAPRAAAAPYVLYVGSFEARKDLVTAVRAFGRIAESFPAHHLVAIAAPGSGDARPARAAVDRLRLAHRVHFVSRVADETLAALYASADVLLCTSRAEGFGLPPLEALAQGTPVVASSLPALREVLGDVALYAPPGDDAAFAGKVSRLLGDAELRGTLAERGRARAASFSIERFIAATLDVYRAAAETRAHGAVPVMGTAAQTRVRAR
jgi:glycosyltransferase involved in cell wall biosynthesis